MILTPNTGGTPIDLLNALKEFSVQRTKDLLLRERPDPKHPDEKKYRAPTVFMMDLPKKNDDERCIPYILIQVLTGKDEQNPAEDDYSTCSIRIVTAVYSDDMSEGKLNVLNVITRLRLGLLKRRTIGGAFHLGKDIEWVVDPAPPVPYFFGEMIMTFEMPPIYPDVMGGYNEEEFAWQKE